jgi:hypothetical protein
MMLINLNITEPSTLLQNDPFLNIHNKKPQYCYMLIINNIFEVSSFNF